MGNIIFSITIGILSLQFFTFTYRINGINRIVYNIPISIFEAAIPLVQDSDAPKMYFDKQYLSSELTSYFDKIIYRYTDRYSFNCYYYVQGDYSICRSEYCDAVEVTLNARITLFSDYSRTMRFYIHKN